MGGGGVVEKKNLIFINVVFLGGMGDEKLLFIGYRLIKSFLNMTVRIK